MKICQLLHAMTTGGAEVLADRIGRTFADRHEVVFACLDGLGELGEKLREDGFRVEVLGRGEGIDVGCMRRLSRYIRDQNVDLIHAHQYTPFFYAAAARMFGASRPIVFTEHGRFFPDLPSRKRAIFNRLMLRRRDRIVAVGEQVRQALIRNESLPPERIDVIYNGIDLNRYSCSTPETRESRLRDELGIGADDVVVVQVARLDSIKDHLTAVRAIGQGIAKCENLHLLIVGDGPERPRIEAEITRLDAGTRVHMLGLRRDVQQILPQCDLLLLTSLSEGIPLTLIEGMACGLPCVSTDVGGVREVVRQDETGLLCEAGDASAVAGALLQLAGDAGLRRSMGQAGRKLVESRFSEEQMFDQYEKLFATF